MNSQVSKYEKSVEDCVNYNFDETPISVKKSQRQLNRAKSLGHQFNGKLNGQKNWSDYKNSYLWLYVLNDNPKCCICEESMKKDKTKTDAFWTISDSHNDEYSEEKNLQIHLKSENHTKAIDLISDKVSNLTDCKLEKGNSVPSFVSNLEWNKLKDQFPWLCFKEELFGCLLCEEYCSKQNKPYHVLTILGNSSKKNLRDFKAFDKHVFSIIHTKALEIVKTDDAVSTNKDQIKRISNITPKKLLNFSPPNVTTRTAIQKSLCDRNAIPDCIDKKAWDLLKTSYPWLYSNNNVMRCSYCEDAFKNHNESMQPTQWTDSKSTENKPITSLKDLRAKYRLNQHESSKNHEIAARALKLLQPAVMNMEKVNPPVEKQEVKSNKETIELVDLSENFKIAIRASRKSAPFKFISYEDKLSNSREESRENKELKSFVKSDDSKSTIKSISSFLKTNEYLNMKSKYDWLTYSNENSFNCSICLEAIKLDPSAIYSNSEIFEPNITFSAFRNRLNRHSSSKNHCLFAKSVGNNLQIDNQETQSKTNFPEFRSTRLKTGTKTKIDYKRMSEGLIQTDNKENPPATPAAPHPPANPSRSVLPVMQQLKKSKESLITWICPQCKSHFRNTDDLIQHISLCDYQLSDSKIELACPCNSSSYRFNTITKLDLHAAQEHDNQSYFHCYICSDRYNRLTSLYNHMLIHHLITSWDPFEAYSPVKPPPPPALESSSSFFCIFCNCNFRTNLLLTKHYCSLSSDCYRYLQPSVILENISPVQQQLQQQQQQQIQPDNNNNKFNQIQEEVTVLDVEELPDDDKEVIYSPIKKSKNQHNRISRNHPLRRFAPEKKQSFNTVKNSMRKSSEIVENNRKTNDIKQSPVKSIKEENNLNNQSKIEESKSNEIDNNQCKINEDNNNRIIDKTKVSKQSENHQKEEKEQEPKIETNNNNEIINQKFNIDMDAEEYEISIEKDPSNTNTREITNKPEYNIDMDAEIDTQKTIIDIKENHQKTNDGLNININKQKSQVKKHEGNVKTKKSKKIDKVKVKTTTGTTGTANNKTKRINNTKKLSKSLFKTPKQLVKIPPEKQQQQVVVQHQIVDLNDIITETESKKLLNQAKKLQNSNTNHSKSTTKSSLSSSPSTTTTTTTANRKEPIRIQSQFSPEKKIIVSEFLPSNTEIPSGLSFMDRMRKIRQLKKNRTEQQRQQMMAIDRRNAEKYERTNGQQQQQQQQQHHQQSMKKQHVNTEQQQQQQYSINDLKTTINQSEKPKSKPHNKRKISIDETTTTTLTTPKQLKIETSAPAPAPIATTTTTNSTSPMKIETFSCDVCQLKFKSLRARDNHATAEHKGLKLFCCKVCNLSFTTHILLRKHAQKYHIDNVGLAVFGVENSSESNFSFSCTFCPLQFTSRSGLNHHITSGHRSEADNSQVLNDFLTKLIAADPNFSPQSCLICQEIMNNEFELDIHTIEHQKECQTEVEPTQFACPKCCRLFFGKDGKSYLKDHYNIVHLEKPLPCCEECDMRFNSTVCYLMHRKFVKNCSKKTTDQLKIEDPYEKLNDPSKLAFVCSRCQTLIAGHSAETRFEEHKLECNSITDKNEDSLVNNSQSDVVDGELKLDMNL